VFSTHPDIAHISKPDFVKVINEKLAFHPQNIEFMLLLDVGADTQRQKLEISLFVHLHKHVFRLIFV